MNTSVTKFSFILLLSLLTLCSCKKGGKSSDPSPEAALLTRDISLVYTTSVDWSQKSFATLDKDANAPYVFSWDQAKMSSSIIHFGLASGPTLVSPDYQQAPLLYNDGFNPTQYGIIYWASRNKLIFDSQPVNVDFDALSGKSIDENIPDEGFGNSNVFFISIQQNQIIRFTCRDTNNVLKYKGYMKVTAANNGNPKTASVTVKYIAK